MVACHRAGRYAVQLSPMVSPEMPADWAWKVAIGDGLTVVLAVVAVVLLHRGLRAGLAAAWVMNVVGLMSWVVISSTWPSPSRSMGMVSDSPRSQVALWTPGAGVEGLAVVDEVGVAVAVDVCDPGAVVVVAQQVGHRAVLAPGGDLVGALKLVPREHQLGAGPAVDIDQPHAPCPVGIGDHGEVVSGGGAHDVDDHVVATAVGEHGRVLVVNHAVVVAIEHATDGEADRGGSTPR